MDCPRGDHPDHQARELRAHSSCYKRPKIPPLPNDGQREILIGICRVRMGKRRLSVPLRADIDARRDRCSIGCCRRQYQRQIPSQTRILDRRTRRPVGQRDPQGRIELSRARAIDHINDAPQPIAGSPAASTHWAAQTSLPADRRTCLRALQAPSPAGLPETAPAERTSRLRLRSPEIAYCSAKIGCRRLQLAHRRLDFLIHNRPGAGVQDLDQRDRGRAA